MKKLFIIYSFVLAVFFGPSILAHPTVKSGNSGTNTAAKVNAILNAEGRPVSSAFDPKVFLNDIRKRIGTRSYMEHRTSKTGDVGDWVCVNDHAFSPAESFMGNMCFWREGTEWLFMYEYWAAPSLRSYWYTGLASGSGLDELKVFKPVLFPQTFNGVVCGLEFRKCGDTHVGFLHSVDNPTKIYYGRSHDLHSWTELNLTAAHYYAVRDDAQSADPTWIVLNNNLYLWFEDQADHDPLNPPSLTLHICDPA